MADNVPKRYELNPLINDWLLSECPPWQTPTAFLNDLVFHALGELHNTPDGLTGVRRLGKPSTDREGTSSLARASETYIPREDINFRVSDPSPSRAPGCHPVLITPDERAEVLPSNAREEKKSKKDPFSYKQIKSELIPADLMHCAEEIIEWWAVKKGTRSERVANRVFDKLRNFSQKDRIEALNAAASGAWADIYEPKASSPAHGRASGGYTQPEFKHPAHQVFTAADFQ